MKPEEDPETYQPLDRRASIKAAMEGYMDQKLRESGGPPPMTLEESRRIAMEQLAATEAGIRQDREAEARRWPSQDSEPRNES